MMRSETSDSVGTTTDWPPAFDQLPIDVQKKLNDMYNCSAFENDKIQEKKRKDLQKQKQLINSNMISKWKIEKNA